MGVLKVGVLKVGVWELEAIWSTEEGCVAGLSRFRSLERYRDRFGEVGVGGGRYEMARARKDK